MILRIILNLKNIFDKIFSIWQNLRNILKILKSHLSYWKITYSAF